MKIILAFIMFLPVLCHADTYQGIEYSATLGEVKTIFPKATFEKLNPAWAQETDALFQITGAGITGTIVVKFYDGRPYSRKLLEKYPDNLLMQKYANRSDDEALRVSWVRWIPDNPIPASRLVSKYGKPSKKGITDNELKPYLKWESRGISASLLDGEKHAEYIDYSFSKSECVKYWLKQGDDLATANKLCSKDNK